MPHNEFSPLTFYTHREWKIAGLLFFSYIAASWLAALYLPQESYIDPAVAIALAALYFGGVRLWPVVLLASVCALFLLDVPPLGLAFASLIATIQAASGAYLLDQARIDPLYRRHRDILNFLGIIIGTAAITPSLSLLQSALTGIDPGPMLWWHRYIATLFSLLFFVPFLLRWFAKRNFKRTPIEIVETAGVFAILIVLNGLLIAPGTEVVAGVPLGLFLLMPLFWIALRLRPRFTTLALLLTAGFQIGSVLAYVPAPFVLQALFEIEVILIALGIACSIVTTLEEDRRVNMNLMRTQMATLKNAIARISSESRAKNDFIAILAHELRNPLAPVVSSIDLLKLRGGRDAEEEEILNVMEDRMTIVRRLLDDLLDISRISEGKLVIEKSLVDLAPIVYRAILSTDHHRKELHQRLVFKSAEAPLYVRGDAVRLEQIFSNLLTNASKYSKSGDTITLSVRTYDDIVEIAVRDHGIGISPAEREAIFHPFYQSEAHGRGKKGLGIGLSLVRNFVELHEGEIEALSEGPGKGSTFVVRLPLLEAPRGPMQLPTLQNTARIPGTIAPRILIVDDNDAAAAAIGRLLELEGCVVTYAYTGAQALAQALRQKPNAVILDIGLPDQDGHTVARLLRARGYAEHLVALSGYNSDDGGDWRAAGFDQYLVKPASLTDLRAMLSRLR
jgi:signal transduction histidine kinase/CheY-like chemotaxis protein